ncbi:collagen alpha-1(I) chain-like [Canis lupus dingo]|uniref:collagen alpha-1(I) chain-like n=1 Tax=Canis lupus dingo TaxID=286419 RepID=UPI0020C324D2|nr:collagen alpha-1(I) chain-like [Canis lupus dingo]
MAQLCARRDHPGPFSPMGKGRTSKDSQPHGIRDAGQEASGEALVVPSQRRAQGEDRAAPPPRAPSCATRPKPALTGGKGAPGERFRVTGRGEAGPEEGGASASGRSTSFRQAAALPVCPSPRRVRAGAPGGVRSAGPSAPCRLPPRGISVVSAEMFPSQPWKGFFCHKKLFQGRLGSQGEGLPSAQSSSSTVRGAKREGEAGSPLSGEPIPGPQELTKTDASPVEPPDVSQVLWATAQLPCRYSCPLVGGP